MKGPSLLRRDAVIIDIPRFTLITIPMAPLARLIDKSGRVTDRGRTLDVGLWAKRECVGITGTADRSRQLPRRAPGARGRCKTNYRLIVDHTAGFLHREIEVVDVVKLRKMASKDL